MDTYCYRKIFKTPLGWAGVAASEAGICGIVLPRKGKKAVEGELAGIGCGLFGSSSSGGADAGEGRGKRKASGLLEKAVTLLREYFGGKRVSFDLPLDLRYYTPFQQAVWKAAAGIPYGETRSYVWIARRIGKPRAARAVGRALGANPVPVIIPCHRVLNSSGSLGGFTGGLEMKKKLLKLENMNGRNGERGKRSQR